MEEIHTQSVGIKIINVLLLIVAFIFNIFTLTYQSNVYLQIAACASFVALLFAFYYVFRGSRKEAGKHLRLFTGAVALSQFFTTIAMATTVEVNAPVYVGVAALCLALTMALAFGKDLGKALTYVFCGVIIAAKIVIVILALVDYSAVVNSVFTLIPVLDDLAMSLATTVVVRAFSEFALACTLFTCYIAKYADKTARGTK